MGGALERCLDGLDGAEQIGLFILARLQVMGFDRVAPAAHLDDRGIAKVLREAVHINGCAGDDELQAPTFGEQFVQVAEQEVDVQAALMGLVHDDGVVSGELAVTTDLSEQQTVGHHLDGGRFRHPVGEAHRKADLLAEFDLELLGDALGSGPGSDAPRLGVADHGLAAQARLQADLG